MHESSVLRMNWFVENYLQKEHPLSPSSAQKPIISILDVGSYDVNGSYKVLFNDKRFLYTGLDMEAGPNVDIVAKKPYFWHMLDDESFDVVISGQAFEHIEFFWLTLSEIVRVLKRGGLICIIAPRGFERHRYPIDTYRFDMDGMIAMARFINVKPLHASTNAAPPGAIQQWYSLDGSQADAMLIAEKPNDWAGVIDQKTYSFVESDTNALVTGFITLNEQKYEHEHEQKNPYEDTELLQKKEVHSCDVDEDVDYWRKRRFLLELKYYYNKLFRKIATGDLRQTYKDNWLRLKAIRRLVKK